MEPPWHPMLPFLTGYGAVAQRFDRGFHAWQKWMDQMDLEKKGGFS